MLAHCQHLFPFIGMLLLLRRPWYAEMLHKATHLSSTRLVQTSTTQVSNFPKL